ncbi:hypothetical protein Pelo_13340 [Pelomyxa schiedti]|nr:hypothetical protein Pelo_13340 [Pelomyxa schiedti]
MQQYVIPSDLVTVVHKVSPTSSRASTPSRPVTPVSSGDVQSNNTENAQQPLNKRRRQDVSPPNTITFNRQHLPHTTNPTSPVDIHSASINTSSDSHPPSITPPPIIDLVSPPTIHSPQPNRNPPLNVAGNPPPIHTSSQPPPIVSNTCPLPPPSPSSDALLDLFSLPPDDLILAL